MNKEIDLDIYRSSRMYWQNRFEPNKRKVYQTRMLKLDSSQSSSSMYGEIGQALLDSGQFQKAVFYLQKASIIEPQSSDSFFHLARALLYLQKENEAFSFLKKGLSFSPTSWNLHSFLIKILDIRERIEEIESFYQEIAHLLADPKDIPRFFLESAKVLTHYNKHSQALGSFKKEIETNIKQDHTSHYLYAIALHREGEFEEAIVQFEKVWMLNPGNKFARNQRAFLHYCAGRVKKALYEFEIIMEEGSGTYVTYSHLLLIMYHLDQDEKIIKKYKNLVQPYLRTDSLALKRLYKDEVRVIERLLDKEDIDEETRKFNEKKFEALDMILLLIE